MDYETKIYLDKFIEAIEELNSPDWWTIILTIINIAAFIFVAITQIRLQKQQKAMQAVVLYDRLFKVLQSIESEATQLIFSIAYFYEKDSIVGKTYDKTYWEREMRKIEKLQCDLSESNIELINPKGDSKVKEKLQYEFLLDSMWHLTLWMRMNCESPKIISISTLNQDYIITNGIPYLVNSINEGLNNEKTTETLSFNDKFQLFLNCRKSVLNLKTLSAISKICNIS